MTLIIKRSQFRLSTKRLSVVFTPQPLSPGWSGIVTWNMVTMLTYNTYASARWQKKKGKLNELFDTITRRHP